MADEKEIPFRTSKKIHINFVEIIKTENMSVDIADELVTFLKDTYSYILRDGVYKGFYGDFINYSDDNGDLTFMGINEDYLNSYKQFCKYNSQNENHLQLYSLNYIRKEDVDEYSFIDIFIVPSFDLIFVQGSKDLSEDPVKKIISKLKSCGQENTDLNPKKLNLDPNFLLWLIYKKKEGYDLHNNVLKFRKFKDMKTEALKKNSHDHGGIPQIVYTGRNDDNELSFPIIYSIVNKRIISQIKAYFKFQRYSYALNLKININKNNDTNINMMAYSVINDVKNYSEKIKLALPMLKEFIEIYLEWENSDDKLVSMEYLNDLKKKVLDESYETLNSFTKYEEEHAKLLKITNPDIIKFLLINHMELEEKMKNKEVMGAFKILEDNDVLLYL